MCENNVATDYIPFVVCTCFHYHYDSTEVFIKIIHVSCPLFYNCLQYDLVICVKYMFDQSSLIVNALFNW